MVYSIATKRSLDKGGAGKAEKVWRSSSKGTTK